MSKQPIKAPKPPQGLIANVTIGDKYRPAMAITTQAEADAYLEKCVRHTMAFGKDRKDAERIEKSNLGYYAGYYDHETRARVERLFGCAHPVFGAISNGAPSPEQSLEAGIALARQRRMREEQKT
jgi:hypothetical protein